MPSWFSVRCIIRWSEHEGTPYEERITLWQADSASEAICLAEEEAREYAELLNFEFVECAQLYELGPLKGGFADGTEVFSLLRDSNLDPDDYLDRFFDTGHEHQEEVEDD
jgi:hypothetical protein